MRLLIIGSRNYPNLEQVKTYIRHVVKTEPNLEHVLSGGARGVDYTVGATCRKEGIPFQEYKPDYDKHASAAPLIRNKVMVDNCTGLVAFWEGTSTGTIFTVEYAITKGIPYKVYNPSGGLWQREDWLLQSSQ